MIEDMTVRGLSADTQRGYIRAVRDFTGFLGRAPDQAMAVDLRRYQIHMRSVGAAAMTTVREPRTLPVVLSPDEVARLLDAAPGLKYKAAHSIAYGASLHASEVVHLKLGDSDPSHKVIRVEQGKGAGTAMPCCPIPYSICCAPGGERHAHKAGCSPVGTRSIR